MPYILTRRVRTSQPQQAVGLKQSHPSVNGLVFCAVPSGGTYIDLVTGVVGTPNGTITSGVYPANNGLSRLADGIACQSNGALVDRVEWPASSTLRGGSLVQTGTVLALGGSTEQVDGKAYMFGGNTTTTGYGDGFSLAVDSYAYAGRGNIIKGRYSGAGTASSTNLLGNPFGLRTHYFGYSFNSNGVNGNWLSSGTATAFSGVAANGTDTVNRQACVLSPSIDATYTQQHNAYVLQFLMWDREISAQEYADLYNNPWQIFEDEEDYIWVPEAGGGVSNIAASGTVQVGGTASPVVAVAMSGVGASLSSGTAADRVTVNIGAAGLATAAATAGISAQVLLAGAAAALASGNATLAATLNALASGAAQASGTATINSGVAGALAAVGTDVVSGSAPIRVTVSLGASGSDAVGGSAAIVGSPISSPLSGAGVDVVSGSGAAVINVSLSAAGFVQAMAAGQLSMQVRLSSTGASVVSGVAGITSLGVTVDAPNGYGPQIIRPKTRRPANLGGIIF